MKLGLAWVFSELGRVRTVKRAFSGSLSHSFSARPALWKSFRRNLQSEVTIFTSKHQKHPFPTLFRPRGPLIGVQFPRPSIRFSNTNTGFWGMALWKKANQPVSLSAAQGGISFQRQRLARERVDILRMDLHCAPGQLNLSGRECNCQTSGFR